MDDFLTLGPPASPVCYNNLHTCVRLCKQLGPPLHPDKLEGPSTRLTILGIELDSETLQARLPAEKRDRIVALLNEWSAKRFCKRLELSSLSGHLHHACKVAPQGRTFLCRMIDLLCAFCRDDHPIRLNQEFRRDLTWWQDLFQTWDGLSFFLYAIVGPSRGLPGLVRCSWLIGLWSYFQIPLVLWCLVSGTKLAIHSLQGALSYCSGDNESVVAVLKSGTSRDKNLMVLLRNLTMLAIRHSFSFTASSVRGKANPIADAPSRFQFQRFRRLAPHADSIPSPIPASLLAALQMP